MNKSGAAAASNLGWTEKAVITLIDERGKEKKEEKTESRAISISPSGLDAIKQDTVIKKRFIVKFNPKTITLTASGQGKTLTTNVAKSVAIKREKRPCKTVMTVDLIFDYINNKEAFISDMLTLNPTQIAGAIIKKKAFGSDANTVRTQVEGFTAAMRNKDVKQIIFTWGRMEYRGTLSSINAAYTMFNPDGEPIRAEVHLSFIVIPHWKIFSSALTMGQSGSAVRKGQQLGSLLNLTI